MLEERAFSRQRKLYEKELEISRPETSVNCLWITRGMCSSGSSVSLGGELDRLGQQSYLQMGWAGLACKHCCMLIRCLLQRTMATLAVPEI